MTKYRNGIDAGKFDMNAVRDDFKAGRLTERDAKTLVSDFKSPQLVRNFPRLSPEQALDVWAVANDKERKWLRPILQGKAKQLENRAGAAWITLGEAKGHSARTQHSSRRIPGVFGKLFGHAVR